MKNDIGRAEHKKRTSLAGGPHSRFQTFYSVLAGEAANSEAHGALWEYYIRNMMDREGVLNRSGKTAKEARE